jgi:hypothetical protein
VAHTDSTVSSQASRAQARTSSPASFTSGGRRAGNQWFT